MAFKAVSPSAVSEAVGLDPDAMAEINRKARSMMVWAVVAN